MRGTQVCAQTPSLGICGKDVALWCWDICEAGRAVRSGLHRAWRALSAQEKLVEGVVLSGEHVAPPAGVAL